MLLITDKQQTKLEEFIGELPLKFGGPLVNLLRAFAAENDEQVKKAEDNVKAEPANSTAIGAE